MKPPTDVPTAPVAAHVARARTRLIAAGIPAPDAAFDAEVLARAALGWDRAALVARGREPGPAGFPERFDRLVERRARREPVAYITGRREFWGLEVEVGPGVLIPRPETELLVEQVLHRAGAGLPCRTLADVGTGSGCIAVALASELPQARVLAIDRSGDAIAVAARNAARHGVRGRIALLRGNLLDAVAGPLDVIVSNPPYLADGEANALQPEVGRFEPALALYAGADGLDVVRQLIAASGAVLAADGCLMLELGRGQQEAVAAAATAAGWRDIQFADDLAGIARVAVLTGPPRVTRRGDAAAHTEAK